MSHPEISRRCRACGVSVRDHARFCPQCGGVMRADEANSSSVAAADLPVNQNLAFGSAPPAGADQSFTRQKELTDGLGAGGAEAEIKRPRIERLREASLDMLEEASEDSGVRFVLTALALFLFFLLLLLGNIILK